MALEVRLKQEFSLALRPCPKQLLTFCFCVCVCVSWKESDSANMPAYSFSTHGCVFLAAANVCDGEIKDIFCGLYLLRRCFCLSGSNVLLQSGKMFFILGFFWPGDASTACAQEAQEILFQKWFGRFEYLSACGEQFWLRELATLRDPGPVRIKRFSVGV